MTIGSISAGAQTVARGRTAVGTHVTGVTSGPDRAQDAGTVPGSQMLVLTVRLKPTAERAAALDALVAAQMQAGSAEYRKWVTPEEFGARFGATEEQIAAVRAWLEAQGLTVGRVSGSKLRMEVLGTAERVVMAFGVELRVYRAADGVEEGEADPPRSSLHPASALGGEAGSAKDDRTYFANVGAASVPEALGETVAGVSGLDDKAENEELRGTEEQVEENATPILRVGTGCGERLSAGDVAAYRAVLRQAEVQGITVLAEGCGRADPAHREGTAMNGAQGSGGDPTHREGTAMNGAPGLGAGSLMGLAEVTAVAGPEAAGAVKAGTATSGAIAEIEARPGWQAAEGLPVDGGREAPDVAVGGTVSGTVGGAGDWALAGDGEANGAGDGGAALAETLAGIEREAGTRLGNVAPVLYALAKVPGLYAQADGAAEGTWERRTGLGAVNLKRLAEVFPRGTTATSTSLTASTYAISVGQTVTFYSTVFSAGVPSTMTGTVTYSAAVQGVLGTGTVAGGLATLTPNTLAAGTYDLTATYSGDATFAGSSSATTVVLTVGGAVATLAGAFTPASVAYGSDAVLTATASFAAGTAGGPVGLLTATITGVAGAMYSQALIASATGPSSVAVFTFRAPVPGAYSVVVSCASTDTFACGAPVTVPLTVGKGATATLLTLTPADPLAGQVTTLTATVSNAGNDVGAYTFTGAVAFYANSKLLGTATMTGATATLMVSLPAGVGESVVAVYSGDVDWATSTSVPVVLTVVGLSTATVVTSSVSAALAGVSVVLTATVTGTALGIVASVAPSGTVTFYDTYGGVLSRLGTAALVSEGTNTSEAMFNATGLAAGTHAIYAVYAGDAVYLGSTSATIALGFTDFSATFVPATMTVTRGASGSASVVVNFQGGFGGTVSFGCTPPPNVELTCSFSPAVLNGGGTTTLQVGTVASSSRGAGERAGFGRFAGGVAVGMVLLWVKPRRYRLGGVGSRFLDRTPCCQFERKAGPSTPLRFAQDDTCGAANSERLSLAQDDRSGVAQDDTCGAASSERLSLAQDDRFGAAQDDRSGVVNLGHSLTAILLVLLGAGVMGVAGCGAGTSAAAASAPVTTPTDPGSSLGTQILSITAAGSDGINTVRHDFQYQVTVQ